jgi:hypothetical protein
MFAFHRLEQPPPLRHKEMGEGVKREETGIKTPVKNYCYLATKPGGFN